MGMKVLVLAAGILASQMAFAAEDCSLAVNDIHQPSVDTMVLKGYVAVDKSQAMKDNFQIFNRSGFFAFIDAIMDDGQFTVVNGTSEEFLLVQKVFGRLTVIRSVPARTIDEAVKALPACKDL